MASPVILGTDSFVEQPKQRQYVRGDGWKTVRTWCGPRDQAESFEATLIATLDPEDISTTEGVVTTIVVTLPDSNTLVGPQQDTEESQSSWELIPVELERPLAMHGYFNSVTAHVDFIERFELAMKKGNGKAYVDALVGAAEITAYGTLRLAGVESFITHSWIVRKTTTTTNSGSTAASLVGINKIYTYADIGVPAGVISKWSVPKVWYFSNTEDFAALGQAAPAWIELPINEWMKKAPSVRRSKRNFRAWYEIVQEWHGAATWCNVLYPRNATVGAGVLIGLGGKTAGGKK